MCIRRDMTATSVPMPHAGSDQLELIVCGRKEQTIVTALFDNLGKGACGAAIQNMNIALGLDPLAGLHIERGK